ncbi:MAG: hypothetical protein ACFE0I_10625 [Elainellaceae cyanobacterium]
MLKETLHGSEIGLGETIVNQYGVPGTLGCFAYLGKDNTRVLLSSYHVLFGKGGKRRENVQLVKNGQGHQPEFFVLGKTLAGKVGTVDYCGAPYYIDCAVAEISPNWQINTCVPSAKTAIRGVATAELGSRVRKISGLTGITEGIVTDINYPDEAYVGSRVWEAPNQILIKPVMHIGNSDDKPRFSTPGDSGAAILNEDNKIIGLQWGCNGKGEGVACHIEPVIQFLNLEIVVEKIGVLQRFLDRLFRNRADIEDVGEMT